MPEPTALQPLPVRDDLPEPTDAEVQHLADLLTEAGPRGVRYGHWTLARVLLGAGYRLMPEPEPLRYGECRACAATYELTTEGTVVEHQDKRRNCLCIGSRVTPLRIMESAETGGGS